MRILLNQKCGLGNQLFQYAAGRYYADRYGADFEVIQDEQSTSFSEDHPRPCLLSHFAVEAPIRKRSPLDRILRSNARFVPALTAPLRRLLGAYSVDPARNHLGEFYPDLDIPKATRRLYLNGYFLAFPYVHAVQERLRRELRFRAEPAGINREVAERIAASANPVSLHVRLGDYLTHWQGKNVLPVSYYEDASARILAAHPDAVFFIFSDDIESARKRLPKFENAYFVDHNSEAEAHEDLRLMSLCRHHILANSSLSWWGAWLDDKPDKTVLVPDPWHTNDHPHLLPPQWEKISRSWVEG